MQRRMSPAITKILSALLGAFVLGSGVLVAAGDAYGQSRREERQEERERELVTRQQQQLALQREEFGELANDRRQEAIQQAQEILETQRLDPSSEAQLRMRLANFYSEQAQYENFKEIEEFNEIYDAWFMAPEGEQGPEPTLDTSRSMSYRALAVEEFDKVLQDFPDFARADEALYALAFSLDEMGQDEQAKDRYQELVRRFPDSGYVPDSYTNIGEYFFENDNAFLALQNYQRATEYPDATIYTFALYKRGWAEFNVGEYDTAIGTMQEVVRVTDRQLAENPEAVGINLKEEALKDLVQFYAEKGDDALEEARAYFTSYGERRYYRMMLSLLAGRYMEQGRNELAIQTYRTLIADDPNAPDNPSHIDEIIKAYWSRDRYDEANVEIDQLIASYGRESAWASHNSEDDEALSEAEDVIEKNLRRAATESHQIALQRRSARMLQLAEDNYKKYIDYFPAGENSYEMRYWYAEVLYKLQKYPDATEQYELVVQADPEGKYLRDAALGAVYAVEEILKPTRRDREREWGRIRREREREGATPAEQYAPIELTDWEQRLVSSCDTYAQALPDDEQTPQLRHRAAYMLFETNHYVEANERFLELVRAQPRSDLAEDAVEIVLNTYENIEDWARLNAAAREFYNNEDVGRTEAFRTRLKNLYLGATLKVAEGIAAEGRDAEATEAYLAFYNEFQNDESAEEFKLQFALFNAAFHAYQAGNRQQSLDLRTQYVESFPDEPDRESDAAQRQFYEKNVSLLGAHYESVADYPNAVRYYDMLVERNPDFAAEGYQSAQNALYNSALFMESGGDWQGANERFASFIEAYPDHETDGVLTADSLRMRIADNHFTNGDIDGARGLWREIYDDDALVSRSFATAFEARALEARSVLEEGDTSRARSLMGSALSVFDRASQGQDDMGTAATFAAEMRFRLVDEQYQEYVAIELTADRNAGRNLRRKTEQRDTVAQAYQDVIQPGAGKWAIAALVGIGRVFDDYARALIESPCPTNLSEDQCEIYRYALQDRAYEPQEQAAQAYTSAMEESFNVGLYTEFSAEAARRLEQLRPEEFPPMYEYLPEPDYQANPFRFSDEFVIEQVTVESN